MKPPLTEELRSSMEQFTEHVVMPSGLARRAYRHWRKRLVVTRAAAAATAVAVVAGAAVAITTAGGGTAPPGNAQPGKTSPGKAHPGKAQPGNAQPGNAQARDAAYVVTHVESALATAGRGSNIFFSRTTLTSVNSGGPAAGFPWRTSLAWSTRGRFNEIEYTSSGRPFFSLTVTHVPGGLQTLTVQYEYRVVIHQELTGTATARGCFIAARVLDVLDANPNDLTNWPATIRALVGCKLLTMAGHQRAGGVDLIRFVQRRVPDSYFALTLLVSPSTFLPSRMVITWSQLGHGRQTTTEFGSLPPTRANLARLAAPRPAGFTQSYQRPEAAGGSVYGQETLWMFGP
jgi:hypothetical protein